jgi:hypothetical protein
MSQHFREAKKDLDVRGWAKVKRLFAPPKLSEPQQQFANHAYGRVAFCTAILIYYCWRNPEKSYTIGYIQSVLFPLMETMEDRLDRERLTRDATAQAPGFGVYTPGPGEAPAAAAPVEGKTWMAPPRQRAMEHASQAHVDVPLGKDADPRSSLAPVVATDGTQRFRAK